MSDSAEVETKQDETVARGREPMWPDAWVDATMAPFLIGFLYWAWAYLMPMYERGEVSFVETGVILIVAFGALAILKTVIKLLGPGVARTLYGNKLFP